jgi:hypothetical protein
VLVLSADILEVREPSILIEFENVPTNRIGQNKYKIFKHSKMYKTKEKICTWLVLYPGWTQKINNKKNGK